ncbi:double-strand break repair helicase AddA [Paracoccus sp. TK19116]|uniref:DNA 3'-5' helicase n=1 Tax=Paracoccus albicereus TaxID=2922394 RepID=A0ABT1MS06_9RHOB|nr:double-strand break repair helicase AddA [Paracoccus albicereus]MCQ0971090.1 double-strand break repair helicase AddA [Paracoccus albicereus]
MDEASLNQIGAADPARSTWLTANAGSGKTRVLTDRVARLLLAGVEPQRILCLTYTKAAATEMQNRLLGRLGAWAMMPEADLRASLASLGETGTANLADARRLFARAIETPGGLKVQTIHSFCAGVLRRFPLEAGVPIGFAELDDRSASLMRAEIVEELADEGHPVMGDLTALHGGHELDRFLAGLSAADYASPPDAGAIWAAFGLSEGFAEGDDLAQVVTPEACAAIQELIPLMQASNATDQAIAAVWSAIDWSAPGADCMASLQSALLTKAGERRSRMPPGAGIRKGAAPHLIEEIDKLAERVEGAHRTGLALAAAKAALALQRFAHEFLGRYAARKAAHGWLDFDDLIQRTADLLSQSDMAQWVLFRLDGGIDHILVDEAQDTSPGQWRVVRALTEEFTAGQGARSGGRTLFVVGDPKQSIYSFQGADIAVFDTMRQRFADDFALANAPMQQRALQHSFRSSPAILRLVDAVFADDRARGLGAPPIHLAHHADLPGRVDIWPALPKPDAHEPGPWWEPVDEPDAGDAIEALAKAIAAQIKAMMGTPFHDIRRRVVRPLTAGDILILVQRRSELFQAVIGACKSADIPIAGADRLKLGGELAVRDIQALLQFVATPEDDLALASALRSPLLGLDEDALYRLAAGRPQGVYLWQRLRESDHANVLDVLKDLRANADYLRPYDLIARLLFRHEGRARLIARLGPEAEDGIAELVSQALSYETVETPSLTGFLTWLSGGDVEVRRQVPAGGGGLVRVMTVHGAKGLESPVVILPDTACRKPPKDQGTVAVAGQQAMRGTKASCPPVLEDAVTEWAARIEDERRRLLYVALTRAESWLIVAAVGETGMGEESWHAMVAEAADTLDGLDRTSLEIDGIGTGIRLGLGRWPDATPVQTPEKRHDLPALPDWADRPAPARPGTPKAASATGLGGAKALGGDGEADRETAMLRGTRLHLLLEILPGEDRADWLRLARDALAGAEGGLPRPDELETLLEEARAVIDAPDLAAVMSPDPGATILREVTLSADLPALGQFTGILDRLIIGTDKITLVDFKSNIVVPPTAEAVPEGILRQMAAYRAALTRIYPGRPLTSTILWTVDRSLMDLPDALLDRVARELGLAGLDPDDPAS